MYKINEEKFKQDCVRLADKINELPHNFIGIYGIPRGGEYVANELSKIMNLPVVDNITKDILIVDDLIDSGKTLEKYEFDDNKAVLYSKPHSPHILYSVEEIDDWIEFWYEDTQTDDEQLVIRMLERIGENPNREGLIDTPKRVVKMWKEIFRGYDETQKPNITVFENGKDGITYDQMIVDKGYFFSHCEHHLVPFFGEYYFAYIPDKKIIGLSKVARIVDFYSAKLQIQERLVKEIVDAIQKEVEPLGIALVMKARHLCKEMRGVKKINGEMITSELRGVFIDKPATREEFLKFTLC